MHAIQFLLICLIWGTNFILMHRAAQAFDPLAIGFWRLLLGGSVLAALWYLTTSRKRLSWGQWPHLLVVGILGNAVPFVLLPLVISRGFGHSYFACVVAFVPLVTIASSIVMMSHWPTSRELTQVKEFGIILDFFGA